MHAKSSGSVTLYLSFFVAMCLSVLPWSNTLAYLMPNWVLLTLVYWCIALPHKVSVGTGWTSGLLVDALSGSLLGQNALIYSLAAFLAHKLYLRLRHYHIWQQATFILFFLLFMQLLALWINQLSEQQYNNYRYWYQPISSAIIWPFVFLLLRTIQRQFKVH